MNYQLIKAPANKLPLENESVQCVVTSPPYWGLRKYEGAQDLLWGGSSQCEHEWGESLLVKTGANYNSNFNERWGNSSGERKQEASVYGELNKGNFCQKCGAWRGGFGLEPSLKMYVEHTIEVLRELRRVLKSDGVVFWNIGDSYNGSGKKEIQLNSPKQMTNRGATAQRGTNDRSLKPKDLCLVPFRTAVAAQEDNWWVRQDIIWAKPNPMPEPVRDRFTDAYEHILMFTKSAKYFWDADACQEPAVMKPQNRFTKRADWPKGDEGRAKHRRPEGATNPETRNMRNVWIFATQPFKGAHFATFPEELPRRCIQAATRSGDTVLDPFCGSGTTGKVALELGRKFIGTDLEYQELAKQRIESAIIKSEFD